MDACSCLWAFSSLFWPIYLSVPGYHILLITILEGLDKWNNEVLQFFLSFPSNIPSFFTFSIPLSFHINLRISLSCVNKAYYILCYYTESIIGSSPFALSFLIKILKCLNCHNGKWVREIHALNLSCVSSVLFISPYHCAYTSFLKKNNDKRTAVPTTLLNITEYHHWLLNLLVQYHLSFFPKKLSVDFPSK